MPAVMCASKLTNGDEIAGLRRENPLNILNF